MKNKLLALFVVFLIPLLYFYSEAVATTVTAFIASAFAIHYSIIQFKERLLPSKLLFITGFLIFVWLLTAGRSLMASCSIYASWAVFIKLTSLVLLAYAICYELATKPQGHIWYYRIAALTGLLQGIIAIIEYIEAPPIPKTWLDPALKDLFRTRCCGIMTDPNIFAAFLSVLFILTLALIFESEDKKEQLAAATSLIFCGTGIFMTLSRGGWIALFAALLCYFFSLFISKRKFRSFSIKILSITTVILVAIFLSGPFKYRLFSITQPSDMTFAQRSLINKGILKSISKLPITGHGLHTFSQVYPLYRIVGGDYPLNAHNEYLHSMIETGFFSSFVLAAITLCLLTLAYKAGKRGKLGIISFSAAFISLLVQNLSGFSSRIFPTAALIALTIGATLSNQFYKTKTAQKFSKFSINNFATSIIIVISIMVIYSSINLFIVQNKLDRANQLLATGNIQDSKNLLEEVLEKQPNNPTAANTLGMIYLVLKQPKKTVQLWKEALEENKYEANFSIGLARLYSSNNKELAEAHYQYAMQLDPASENFRLEYAKFLIEANKKPEARRILEIGLSYSPGFHNVYTGFKEIEELLASLNQS